MVIAPLFSRAASGMTRKSRATPISTAMVLAAGFGTRMRPLTDTIPKPMVQLAGRPLIDHVLDRIADTGITRAVVNVHHFADLLEAHVKRRTRPAIIVSDERHAILETGGGVVKALPLLGPRPFLIHNSDAVWIEGAGSNIGRLVAAWDDTRMDALLLLAPVETMLGYDGAGDFSLDPNGHLQRRRQGGTAPYVFTGVSIARPRLFEGAPAGPHSLNVEWNEALGRGRLFGVTATGQWMHVGTPQGVIDAERCILSTAS
jgi:N-acetyl-alpha-D-muramate 1-phosphate uridylyltransferase